MRLISHTPTLRVLFEDIARQLFAQFVDPEEVGEALREKIGVEGESLNHLLQIWSNTLLDLFKRQKLIFRQVHVTRLETADNGPYIIEAELVGEHLDPHRHTLHQYPSQLTCRQAHLTMDTSGYRAEVSLA